MLLVKTRIAFSSIHGIGLFAEEDIPKGTVVWEFMPPFDLMVSAKKVNALPEAARAQVLRYSYYDDEEGKYVLCGDDARHFNHSETPNTGNGCEEDWTENATIAVRDIRAGEEITCNYFDFDGEALRSYEDNFEACFNAQYTIDLIEAVWGQKPPYKLLDCGSANGLTLEQFEKYGIEAWGIENNQDIHAKTPDEWLKRNLLGDVRKMPFEDNAFDFVYVTCLCYLPEEEIDDAIRELFRVCRIGIVAMGFVTDMTPEVIDDYSLFYGVRTYWTLWEWSEAFVKNGFHLAISDPAVLNEVWRIEQETDPDDWDWYRDKESIRYCFFSKPDVEARRLSAPTPADAIPRTPIPRRAR